MYIYIKMQCNVCSCTYRCGSYSEEASYSGHSSEVLVLSNTNSSPMLAGKTSCSPVDRNSLASTGSEKPLEFNQQSRERPASLDMVDSDLNSRLVLSTCPYYREYILIYVSIMYFLWYYPPIHTTPFNFLSFRLMLL